MAYIWLKSPPLHVSDFVDHRFPVLSDGYTSHPPSDFPIWVGLIWVG